MKRVILYTILFCLVSSVYAVSTMLSARDTVANLNQTIEYLKKNSQLDVIFPKQIPSTDSKTKLYASQSSLYDKPNYNQYWVITVARTADCQSKNCTIGMLSATKDGKLELTYIQAPLGPNVKFTRKEKVMLKNNIVGYFTPGHAEADFHPATIEWEKNKTLYALSWNIDAKDAKKLLTKMAVSATS